MNARFPPPPKPDAKSDLLGPLPALRVVKKAVILAGGRGRRMGKLTADRPKAALVVGDHALIDWQIAALQAAGVEEIAVVTGHGAQALAGRGVTYIHNPNWADGTQVETLLCARDWIGEEPVIVSYGDILYHPCAALALLERPSDIVIAYDADHRWLWKKRFGNWLKDSETFRLGPGQVLTEIGGKPTDIEELDGQFMGLMLFTPAGLAQVARRYRAADAAQQKRLDFTRLLSELIAVGARIDTAANVLPWMEVDGPKDLELAQRMTERDEIDERNADLVFFGRPPALSNSRSLDAPTTRPRDKETINNVAIPPEEIHHFGMSFNKILSYEVNNAFAVQNWGRSGSTFLQSLLDNHPQILSTPNFYSRNFYVAWAKKISQAPDVEKIDVFLLAFQQWWDSALVDAAAGLHRLGSEGDEIAGVDRYLLEGYLRAAFADGRKYTRRNLFIAAHLAYALARGQSVSPCGLQILYPVHGQSRAVAASFLEDFPTAKFIHTIRDPIANVASSIHHIAANDLNIRQDTLEGALKWLFDGWNGVPGRTHTSFSTSPYFPYLITEEQIRYLRLEDLNMEGNAIMEVMCNWLGISHNNHIIESSWDGKLWGNRPEIGSPSTFNSESNFRHVKEHLSPNDRKKVDLLATGCPAVAAHYAQPLTSRAFLRLRILGLVMSQWRQEASPRASTYLCLAAIYARRRWLPRFLVSRTRLALTYESKKARLIEMADGAIQVRRRLPHIKRSNTVDALVVLRRPSGHWRARLLAKPAKADQTGGVDRIAVAVLDESLAERTFRDEAFWLFALGIGWALHRVATYARVRAMMISPIISGSKSTMPIARRLTGLESDNHASEATSAGHSGRNKTIYA